MLQFVFSSLRISFSVLVLTFYVSTSQIQFSGYQWLKHKFFNRKNFIQGIKHLQICFQLDEKKRKQEEIEKQEAEEARYRAKKLEEWVCCISLTEVIISVAHILDIYCFPLYKVYFSKFYSIPAHSLVKLMHFCMIYFQQCKKIQSQFIG